MLFAVGIIYLGVPPLVTTLLVFLDTMMVGFSEEGMFRGLLFRASIERMSIWPAIIYHSLRDFAIFTLGIASKRAGGVLTYARYLPVKMNLPNFIFSLILLRNMHKDSPQRLT